MGMIINPGSGPVSKKGAGWSNTIERAREYAREWHERMKAEGIVDVDMTEGKKREGRWVFNFTHRVTGVTVPLEHHGIDNLEAYKNDFIFEPRVYWNGSSCGDPQITDWLAKGFKVEQRIVPLATKDGTGAEE